MSNIEKKYVDYAGLQSYDSQIKGVISTDFVGATSSVDGAAGRVPAPESGDENKFLRGDGTWSSMSGGVTGVKGDAETDYRNGNVNITPADIGLGNVKKAIKDIENVISYNIIPCTAVKTSTVDGVTITNNLDGSYTIDGTPTSGVAIDPVSGVIAEGLSGIPDFCIPIADTIHLTHYRFQDYYVTLGNENVSNIRLRWGVYPDDMDTCYDSGVVTGTDGIKGYYFGTGWNVRYLRFCIHLTANETYDNVVIRPVMRAEFSGDRIPNTDAGSFTSLAMADYVQKYTKRTFMGTTAEWTALSTRLKNCYQIVILTDD